MNNILNIKYKQISYNFSYCYSIDVVFNEEEVLINKYDFNNNLINSVTVNKDEFLKDFNNIHIEKWKKEYLNKNGIIVFDDLSWTLIVNYLDNELIINGNGNYPKNFNKLMKLFNL